MKQNNRYITGVTLVATLGGLLFGYDTAVISGTVESLRKMFIEPYGLSLDQANALEGFVVCSALIGCIIGALIMAVSMMILGTTFYTHSVGLGSLICMLVYTAGFAMSWGPVCWVLLAEIFPNSIRSTVMSIAVAGQWIANFVVSWTFPMLDKNRYLTETFNHGVAYWIYGMMGLFAAIFIWKMVPETKGKKLEDMNAFWGVKN